MIDALSLAASLGILILVSVGFLGMFAGVLRRFVADHADDLVIGRIPAAAIVLAAAWLVLPAMNRFVASKEGPREPSLPDVQLSCLISLIVAGMMIAALTKSGRRSAANQGLAIRPIGRRVRLGIAAYLASIGPTALLLILSSYWRTMETQHSYLKALREEAGAQLLLWIVLSAVVAAPITEELLFRVTLQGWFNQRYAGPVAIGLTALVFALVHGWRDALPLIPLSLILGAMFYSSRSYLSCVVTHALFNGTNIALALLTSPSPRV